MKKYRLEIFKEGRWFKSSKLDMGSVYALHHLFIRNRKQKRMPIPKHRIEEANDD